MEKPEPQVVVPKPEVIVEEKPRVSVEDNNVQKQTVTETEKQNNSTENNNNKKSQKKSHFGGLFSGFKDMFDKMTNVDDKDY